MSTLRSYSTDAATTSPDSKITEAEPSLHVPDTRRNCRLTIYRKAQANGFQGTKMEFEIEEKRRFRKQPENTASITTLQLEEALSRHQFIHLKPKREGTTVEVWQGHAVFKGEAVGPVIIRGGAKPPTFPMNEDVCPYMPPGSYTLRLRKRDGSDHAYQIDVRDFMDRLWCRTLADLATRQGLIKPIKSDGYIRTFDFGANVEAQYRMVFKRSRGDPRFRTRLHYTPQIKAQDIRFHVNQDDIPNSSGLFKGFFYIDGNGMMRLWDVDRERNISWRIPRGKRFSAAWSAEAVQTQWPSLWAHANRLGHWPAKS